MNEEFNNAVMLLVTEINKLYGHVSRLLVTADGQMVTNGWRVWPRSPAVTGSSAIQNPGAWLPKTIHRFYQRTAAPLGHRLPFVAVHLYDPDLPQQTTEPLITAGFVDFGNNEIAGWPYSSAQVHLRTDALPPSGELMRIPLEAQMNVPWQYAMFFWHPLAAITDEAQLRALVTDPLAAAINQ